MAGNSLLLAEMKALLKPEFSFRNKLWLMAERIFPNHRHQLRIVRAGNHL